MLPAELIVFFRHDRVSRQQRRGIAIEYRVDEKVEGAAVLPGDDQLNRLGGKVRPQIGPGLRLAKDMP